MSNSTLTLTLTLTRFAKTFPDVFTAEGSGRASANTGPVSITFPKNKFYWQSGPSEDVVLEYESLDAWVQELPMSRVWAGVHFKEAGEAGLELGYKVGDACSMLHERLQGGDALAT